MDRALREQTLRLARRASGSLAISRPPVSLPSLAARCGAPEISVDGAAAPYTPQWNGRAAIALARVLIAPLGVPARGETVELLEVAAAELLLPARLFAPLAARTDLTMDGLRDLARRFSAPIRLTLRQWLGIGNWSGFALLWRDVGEGLRLVWRAGSPRAALPSSARIGAIPEDVWRDRTRFEATFRTGRPHHGVEEVWTGTRPAWWFTRFGAVREDGSPAVLALVVLDRRGARMASSRSGRAPRPGGPGATPRRRGRDRPAE